MIPHGIAGIAAAFLSAFIAGVAVAAAAGWVFRARIRTWLPRRNR